MTEDSSSKLILQRQCVARNELALNRERERLRKADTPYENSIGWAYRQSRISKRTLKCYFKFAL